MFDLLSESTMNYKTKVYIASKTGAATDDYGNQIEEFDTPKTYMLNVQPVSASSEIAEFGELASGMRKALVSKSLYINTFKKFDRVYLDGATPDGETKHGEKANYRIYSVQPQNVALVIYFTKIVKGDE